MTDQVVITGATGFVVQSSTDGQVETVTSINGTVTVNTGAIATEDPPTLTEGTLNVLSSNLDGQLRVIFDTVPPVSGTVAIDQANPGTTNNVEASGHANAAAPSYGENTDNPLSLDLDGNLRVTMAGATIETGGLATAAAPSYGEGTVNPLSGDLAGNLRVKLDGITNPIHVIADSGTITTVSAVTGITNPVHAIVDSGTLTAVTGITNPVHVIADSGTITAVTSVTNPVSLAAETTKVIGTVNQGTSPWVTTATATVSGNVTVIGPTADGVIASTPPVLIAGTSDGTGTGTVQIPHVTANGQLQVEVSSFSATPTIDINVRQVGGISTGTNNGSAGDGTQRVTIADNSTGQVKLAAGAAVIGHVIADTGSTTAVTGNVTVVQPAGTSLHAVLDTTSTTAVTQGTATNLKAEVIGTGTFVTQATLAAETTKVIGTVNQGTSPWVVSGTSTITGAVTVSGTVADGSAAAPNPVLIAGSTDGTAAGNVALPKVSAGGLVSVDGSAVTQPVSGNLTTVSTVTAVTGITNPVHVIADSGTITTVSAVTGITNPIHVIADSGTITTVSAVTAITNAVTVVGPTADGSAATTNPVLIAGTTDGTAGGNVAIPKIGAGGVLSVEVSSFTATPTLDTNLKTVNGNSTITDNGNAGAGVLRVTVAADSTGQIAVLGGKTAADAALANNPVTTGGLAKTANPTAVSDADVVNSLHDKLGKQICVSAIRDLKSRQVTTITTSTAETTIVTAAASTFNDIYALTIANTSGTACNVTVKDDTAGTTVWTFAVPAGQTVGFRTDCGSAAPQTTVNKNWTATCSASVTSIFVTAEFVKNT